MPRRLLKISDLTQLIRRLDDVVTRPADILLVGETSSLAEGWRSWTSEFVFCSNVDPLERAAFNDELLSASRELDIPVNDECPGEIIPLPEGHETRIRQPKNDVLGQFENLRVRHFDPYSVCFRYIARGTEPDYHLVLEMLDHGWVTLQEMDQRLTALLPEFSMETIQQDPAEFRRRYIGMLQMQGTLRPKQTHRPTPV